jgi:hypothetical protein
MILTTMTNLSLLEVKELNEGEMLVCIFPMQFSIHLIICLEKSADRDIRLDERDASNNNDQTPTPT